jgi:hypothetical protein
MNPNSGEFEDAARAEATMRVLVCGSRVFRDEQTMRRVLEDETRGEARVLLIHGGCRGADALAGKVAQEKGWDVQIYRADWENHGHAAGPIRNQKMLEKSKPTLVLAFPLTDSRGTKDMIRRAEKAGVECIVIERSWAQ